MSAALVLYDDARARGFEPFALTRPAGELRAGAELTRVRWARAAGTAASGFVGAAHLAFFHEFDAPRATAGVLAAGTIVANTRCAIALDASLGNADAWRCDGRVAAVRLGQPLDTATLADGRVELASLAAGAAADVAGWWIDEMWDLIGKLAPMLQADLAVLAAGGGAPPPHVEVLGEHEARVERGAFVEPYVLFDTREGPVLVREGARVAAFTRLVGPCVIGAHTQVLGGKVRGSSLGDDCRVHGEVGGVIFLGQVNKAHDGFVGDSVVGRWANLGAGTITSNLKNSYGAVSLWTPTGIRATGLTFLGSFIGDHAKLGIGTRLTTGSVIGAGANLFGTAMPPKHVPPFAWGDAPPYATFDAGKFLEVASRVMARRGVTLDDDQRTALREAWEQRGVPEP